MIQCICLDWDTVCIGSHGRPLVGRVAHSRRYGRGTVTTVAFGDAASAHPGRAMARIQFAEGTRLWAWVI